MKTFKDLNPGDIIYELDLISGIVCETLIINILPIAPEGSVFIKLKDVSIPICFKKKDSSLKIYEVIYFCNKEDCINQLQKISKKIKVLQKSINNSIKQLS